MQETETALIMLAGAVLLDWTVGEYPRLLHPVVWLGKCISAGVRLAPRSGWWRQFLYGTLLTLLLTSASTALVWLILDLSADMPVLHIALGIFCLKAAIALRALLQAARQVCRPLEQGKLFEARVALRSLCSRDPADLTGEELLQATIESLAENASDSWVAPLCYFLLFGVPGAVAYRAINTLDAMIGYRGRFEALGKFAARLDDVANWLPARLTAGLLLLSGALLRNNVSGGWRILRRDAARTPSPNAGRPMAAMAGLLDVRLEKKAVYALGDPRQPVTVTKAAAASRLVVCVGMLMACCGGTSTMISGSVTRNLFRFTEPPPSSPPPAAGRSTATAAPVSSTVRPGRRSTSHSSSARHK